MCEREVADPQLVHGAQGSQTAVEGVAPLHANQTGCLVHAEGLHDVCGAGVCVSGGWGGGVKEAEAGRDDAGERSYRRCCWQT